MPGMHRRSAVGAPPWETGQPSRYSRRHGRGPRLQALLLGWTLAGAGLLEAQPVSVPALSPAALPSERASDGELVRVTKRETLDAPIALRRWRDASGRIMSGGAARIGTAPPLTPPVAPPLAPAPWWAPVASGVVPGAGQFALRQQRSVAYLVAEAFLLVQYVAAQRDGNRERSAYRDLAMNVARKAYGGSQPGSWEYYERLEQFLESGAYDRIPGGPLDPETDVTTYNGFRWQLARETFWLNPRVPPPVSSPEYQRALAFYERNAVTDAFRWSWRDARLEQDVYIQTIRSANRSYQRAVNMLGVVAANHLASLVDAYVTVRLRRFGGVRVAGYAVDGMHVGLQPLPTGETQWHTGVRLSAR